ncbi:TIGR03086 family metal-binding protein [Krasilnikoviella flava]|uniref:TIGR03086 family protein n=1 Tax=Krasilnikoviella flava TaxID=526729 RepID=A0A1T5KZC8_9MICO|nr:TIGR03086 family metal-binding protein [Krasilnikoviella flava]SKC69010.1 TIGR03086 family protein [Krasilnikoviella flava]
MDTFALHTTTETLAAYLSEVAPGDLVLATPCEGWDVGDLYRHLLTENAHFGLAVAHAGDGQAGVPPDPSDGVDPPARELDAAYRRTAAFMERAFAATGDPARTCRVPGVPGDRSIHDLYEMQLCDTVIHTWDLAHAIGLGYDPDPEIAELVLRRLESVPDSARGRDRAFGQVQSPLDRASNTLERLIVLSGRHLGTRT